MLQPGIRAWSPARRAAGGRGLRSPLPPTTPNPALGQPSLTRDPRAESVPLPPLCRAAAGVRTPAVPRKRGTSVRPASELPPLSGRRSPPRPAALTSANRIVVPALQAVRHPLLWNGENGFPLLSQSTVPENRCQPGKNSSLDGGRHFFTAKRILPPSSRCLTKRALRFPAQRESRKKSHQPSEPGRGGDPRAAGAPQQARISPAKREDARRLPLRRAADREHDMRQRRPPPHGQGGVRGS